MLAAIEVEKPAKILVARKCSPDGFDFDRGRSPIAWRGRSPSERRWGQTKVRGEVPSESLVHSTIGRQAHDLAFVEGREDRKAMSGTE